MPSQQSTDWAARLRSSGRRLTPERELLLSIVKDNPHLDAEAIYRMAKRQRPHIGLATVYRTLTLLKELDIIHTAGFGENHEHFEVREKDHVHLVCTTCGRIVDVDTPPTFRAIAKRAHFDVGRVRFEMFGTCQACRSKSGPGKGN